MIDSQGANSGKVVMQNIPSAVRADDGTKMDFKDEIEDEFDDLNTDSVKSEIDGDRISLKSPISKDAFDVVDEFIGDEDNSENINGKESIDTNSDSNGEIDGNEEDINGAFNPLEMCEDTEMLDAGTDSLEEAEEDGNDVDPLMNEDEDNGDDVDESENQDVGESEQQSNSGKRKFAEVIDETTVVRKSSRLRSKAETKDSQKVASPEKPKEKQKMLQRPEERPTQIGIDEEDVETSDQEVPEDTTDVSKNSQLQLGDPSREPGKDATRLIDFDFLMPFFQGWVRECVYREMKIGPAVIENVYYHPPSDNIDHGTKAREAKRKRRNKHDQERYFEDFPSEKLSINNFSYVKRELGLNNEAYEKITNLQPGIETRGEVRRSSRKVASYKEVAEHEGLLESEHSEAESSDGGVEEVTDFDIGLPLTLQIQTKVTPYREEHKKRRKYPDRRRCVTPPLAADISWTQLDDDPLGVWTELRDDYDRDGWPEPSIPPELMAVRLTHQVTVENIDKKLEQIRSSLVDPLQRIVSENKDLMGSDNLQSHDLAIRKYKHLPFAANRPPVRPGFNGSKKAPPSQLSRPSHTSQSRPNQNATTNQGFVKVRLPMQSSNGKRPVVELVMLTEGKYQPIKFTNNRQVTEAIPKRLFDQANMLRKTLYQRSVQVPKIGNKQVFLAINPTPGGVKPYSSVPSVASKPSVPQVANSKPLTDQVSILVRPSAGGNAVLLNVPRNVALKVKIGTTLSFSASTDQKYTVIDNKLHPPVGKHKPPANATRTVIPSAKMPSLPSGVSIRPVVPGAASRQSPVTSGRPALPSHSIHSPSPTHKKQAPKLPSRTVRPDSTFSPCSPFCPGVTGIPELECTQCHSLFHPKCVSIPQWQVTNIMGKFKCKRCAGGKSTEVIDLD